METVAADLRLALRGLRKSPGFAATAIAALALGIGANTAIFSVVNAVLLRPLPYPEPDRIVRIERKYPNGTGDSQSIPRFIAFKNGNRVFDGITAYDFAGPGLNLTGGDRPEQVKGIHVSADYFRVFGVSPARGRPFTAEEDRPGGARVAVLSDGLWRRRFGADPKILGKPITLSGDQYTLIGIMPAKFQPNPPADVWIPLQADPNSVNYGNYLRVAARLKPGVSLETARAQMNVVNGQFRRAHPKVVDPHEKVAVIPMQEEMTGNIRPALLILVGAVCFVLLIACANVANLLLARASARQKELAIRAAIGASRGRIIRQLLTESIVLSAAGGILGLVAGTWGVLLRLSFSPGDVPRIGDLSGASAFSLLDWRVIAFTVGIAFFTGILFGLFPALHISKPDLNSTLKETSGRSGTGLKQNKARGALVVTEMAMALVLLIGAALLIRTFVDLRIVATGIDAHNVLTMQMSMIGDKYSKTAGYAPVERMLTERIESLPGVVAATDTVMLPLQGDIDLPIRIEGKPPKSGDQFNGDEYWRNVGYHFFQVFRIPLLRGRYFNEQDTTNSTPVVIVNQSFAKKYWPKEDAVGKRMTIGGADVLGPQFADLPRQIVGIVGDTREAGLNQPPIPTMYIPTPQTGDGLMALGNSVLPRIWAVKTAADPLTMSATIQRAILSVNSDLPVTKVQTMEKVLEGNTARENFNMLLLGIFAGIALLLAAIGIYGVMAYTVEQRTHEIGIRMALGAGRGRVLKLVVGQGMKLAVAGVVIGLLASFGLTRLLAKLLYGVKPSDPLTFAVVAVVLTAVALVATYIPAIRAMRVDPIIALRYE